MRRNLSSAIASAAMLACALTPASTVELSPEQWSWLDANTIEISSVEPGHDDEDLHSLRAGFGNARVIALGEGTHGTHEFCRVRHRLIEFLVAEMGFTVLSIEASMPEAARIGEYVLGGPGDVDTLIAGLQMWPWRTEEMRDLVEWMRAYNSGLKSTAAPKRVHFTGFDMQFGSVALGNVVDFLVEHDSGAREIHQETLARLQSYVPNDFGCAMGRLPVDAARGKLLRYSGWVKTEDVEGGWASLWIDIHGPTRRSDNMAGRGLRGTREWTEMAIEIEVPEDAEEIQVGLLMWDTGRAWFDGLSLELDGVEWSPDGFDVGFELGEPSGIVHAYPDRSPSEAYAFTIDRTVVKQGSQSARLESRPRGPDYMSADRARDEANRLLVHMTRSRARYLDRADPEAVEWAIQNARILAQWSEDLAGGNSAVRRDRFMAENVLWILEQNPAAKVILWAHNGHITEREPSMGVHLSRALGEGYVTVALCAAHGSYRAIGLDGTRGYFRLAEPPDKSLEAVLERYGRPRLLVHVAAADSSDPGSAWLRRDIAWGGNIGAMEEPSHYMKEVLPDGFDWILFLRDTTPARPIPRFK